MARNGIVLAAAACILVLLPVADCVAEGLADGPGQAGLAPQRAPAIRGGHDGTSAWMVAHYRQLQVTKRFDSAARTLHVDLRAVGDLVQFSITDDLVTVARHNRSLQLDSPEAFHSLQELLGGSAAVFAVRDMLSDLESESALQTPEMSLLSTAAFVASLVGDHNAPRRLSDRFVAKHRGLFRRVVGGGATCWQEYTVEVTNAWDDLQGCMDEADQDLWWWSPFRRVACNGVWLMRSESAWFEYLKCLSPMSTLQP